MQNYHLIHASLNGFMSMQKNQDDVDRVVSRGPHIVALTEVGNIETVRAIRTVVGHRMQIINPDAGDILFLVAQHLDVMNYGGPLAIPGTQHIDAAHGGHGPRHNSFVTFELGHEHVTHTAIHTVVASPDKAPHMNRRAQQLKQVDLMAKQMVLFGQGRKLATGSGDLNAELPHQRPMQDLFDKYGLSTTVEETGNTDDTHGNARLDYVWTYDKDTRLSVRSMKVLHGQNSDHNPVEVYFNINQGKKPAHGSLV